MGIYPPLLLVRFAKAQGHDANPSHPDLQWSGIVDQCSQYHKHTHNFHQLDVSQSLCHEKHSQSQYTPQILLDLRCHPPRIFLPKNCCETSCETHLDVDQN